MRTVSAEDLRDGFNSLPPVDYRSTRIFCALAIFTALLGSTTPSPLYPLYVQEWSISQSAVTSVFAIYTIGALISFRLTGNVKRWIDPPQYIVAFGMVIISLGALIMALAPDLKWLLFGRFLTGLGTGAVSGIATASLYDMAKGKALGRATFLGTIAFTAGAAIGPVTSSLAVLIDVAPTVVAYLPVVGLSLVSAIGLYISRCWPGEHGRLRAAPGEGNVEPAAAAPLQWARDSVFTASVLALSITWIIGSTLMALGSATALAVFGIGSPALTGILPAIFQFLGGIGQYFSSQVMPRRAIAIGYTGLLLSQLAIALSIAFDLVTVFCMSIAICGLAYGAAFVGAVGLLSGRASESERSALISDLYLFGYLVHWMPAVAVGFLADVMGLPNAFLVFAIVAASSTALVILQLLSRQRKALKIDMFIP